MCPYAGTLFALYFCKDSRFDDGRVMVLKEILLLPGNAVVVPVNHGARSLVEPVVAGVEIIIQDGLHHPV